MRYKVRHYMNIDMSGESKECWERLRSSKKNPEYCIESDPESYEQNCIRDKGNQQLAQILIGILGGGYKRKLFLWESAKRI